MYAGLHKSMSIFVVLCLWVQQMTTEWTWGLASHTHTHTHSHVHTLLLPVTGSSQSQAARQRDSQSWRSVLDMQPTLTHLHWGFEDKLEWHLSSTSNLWLTPLLVLPLYPQCYRLSWRSHVFLLLHPSVTVNPCPLSAPRLFNLSFLCLFILQNFVTVQEIHCVPEKRIHDLCLCCLRCMTPGFDPKCICWIHALILHSIRLNKAYKPFKTIINSLFWHWTKRSSIWELGL